MEKENNPKEGVHVYELSFHIIPTIAEEQVAAECAKVKSAIEAHKAAFISEEFPAMRSLAYSMTKKINAKNQKFTSAYFGWVKFEAPADEIPALKQDIDANVNILRHLLIHTVRENTLVTPKMLSLKNQKGPKGEDDAPQANPEELDKSIDQLVIQ